MWGSIPKTGINRGRQEAKAVTRSKSRYRWLNQTQIKSAGISQKCDHFRIGHRSIFSSSFQGGCPQCFRYALKEGVGIVKNIEKKWQWYHNVSTYWIKSKIEIICVQDQFISTSLLNRSDSTWSLLKKWVVILHDLVFFGSIILSKSK